jgi:DNA-binding NarL/FixJ family response regulator
MAAGQAEHAGRRATRVVVHEREIVRAGLKAIIASAPDFEVVGEAGPGDDLLRLVAQAQPDVVLLNPRLPAAGADACARLLAERPSIRILIVSTHAAIDLVGACIAAGAHGYVLMDIEGRKLLQAIRSVHRGEVAVSPALASQIMEEMRALVRVRTQPDHWPLASDQPEDPSLVAVPRLSTREREVLARLLDGERVASIAADLFVSQSTVRNHLSSIFRKVGVHSQSELIRQLRSG